VLDDLPAEQVTKKGSFLLSGASWLATSNMFNTNDANTRQILI